MFGKIIGAIFGFYLTRSFFGAFIGIVAGHVFIDRAMSRVRRRNTTGGFGGFSLGSSAMFQRQDVFFQLFFGLLGKLAKVDGAISQEEEKFLSGLLDNMQMQGQLRAIAMQYFHKAYDDGNSYEDMAREFVQISRHQPQLIRQLLYQLVGMASSDRVITSEERKFLEDIASIFTVSHSEVEHMLQSFGAKDDKPYHVLGVSSDASDEEIKKVYRELLKDYHPDTLQSKGLHPSMLDFANRRFLDIKEAWISIKKTRNIE